MNSSLFKLKQAIGEKLASATIPRNSPEGELLIQHLRISHFCSILFKAWYALRAESTNIACSSLSAVGSDIGTLSFVRLFSGRRVCVPSCTGPVFVLRSNRIQAERTKRENHIKIRRRGIDRRESRKNHPTHWKSKTQSGTAKYWSEGEEPDNRWIEILRVMHQTDRTVNRN